MGPDCIPLVMQIDDFFFNTFQDSKSVFLFRTCIDVDECENFRGRGHLCIGLCINIPGSFKCTCPDGYSLAADGRTCKGDSIQAYFSFQKTNNCQY